MEVQTFSSQNSSMAGKERPKRLQTVSIMVSDETKALLVALAEEDSRSVSWTAHELLQRGISAYKRDGLVKEPEGQHIRGRKAS
jgi:hypothetical protein